MAAKEDIATAFRSAGTVMDLRRLGGLYQYRLSFMRSLVRRFMSEKWQIERRVFDLDQDGFGVAIYEIRTAQRLYSFVAFSHYLDPSNRSDRVIANAWDLTVTLCDGHVDQERLARLQKNVPLQEEGRFDADCIVLSRANKSVRNFDYVVDSLAAGSQPSLSRMATVGYLYRTTAVYGSGKFGMADWEKVRTVYADFARPFAAEMFTCYLIRQFSLDQADFLAERRGPETAMPMDDAIKRYMGIGNATGLGMAPYLITHPKLISHWIEVRETALVRVLTEGRPDSQRIEHLERLIKRAIQHLDEIATANPEQNATNQRTRAELTDFLAWFAANRTSIRRWEQLTEYAWEHTAPETQELLNTVLMEINPELIDELEDSLCVDEDYEILPEFPLTRLQQILESHYDWALNVDFESVSSTGVFWYRSEEKMEPRLGKRGMDPGAEVEMAIDVARSVRNCYDNVRRVLTESPDQTVAGFVFAYPEFRYIVRRVQTMAAARYGDIQTNLLDDDVLPIHLLRCKLSFFGVGKFDPKSRLWVRNTMFQGAPILADIGSELDDDWSFPVMPPE